MAVRYLDRIANKIILNVPNYQLIGCACFMIAAKVCEGDAPPLNQLVSFAMGAFNEKALGVFSLM